MDYLALGDNLVAFKDNRIVAKRNETTESEDLLLKQGSIKRIGVFQDFGTDIQMSEYFKRLSKLIGEDIELLENRKIKFKDKELDTESAQEYIFDFVKGLQ